MVWLTHGLPGKRIYIILSAMIISGYIANRYILSPRGFASGSGSDKEPEHHHALTTHVFQPHRTMKLKRCSSHRLLQRGNVAIWVIMIRFQRYYAGGLNNDASWDHWLLYAAYLSIVLQLTYNRIAIPSSGLKRLLFILNTFG